MVASTATIERPTVSNPFQVYPIQPLAELTDIRAATVETLEIRTVREAVDEYAQTFDPDPSRRLPPRHLVLAVKGDFGTGKTHLLMYALAELESRIIAMKWPDAAPGEPVVRSVLAVANEVPIEDWYRSVLGPALVRSVRPRDLIRALMIEVACKVAEQSEMTRPLAAIFRQSPRDMFEIIDAGDQIDGSRIEDLFQAELARLAADADDDTRRCMAALRWTETAPLAERWLLCTPIDAAAEAKTLGVSTAGDAALRAASFIGAMAAICRELDRPFVLLVDEFEHLARYDDRNKSRRNITWLKRLIETLSRCNAMALVSGHWKAWEQQGDFLDRFTGRPALQLVRLDTGDILSIIKVCAPDWVPTFPEAAASTLADVTSGNIRRVMTILYDLYARCALGKDEASPKLVNETAAQRLHRAPEEGFVATVEQAVRELGGNLERDAIVAGERFDGVARQNGALRLVVKVVHARDESVLLSEGEQLADVVRAIRRTTPKARGLFIAVGAVNPEHLRTLDGARGEIDVVDGEAPAVGARINEVVAAALASDEAKVKPDAEVARLGQELLELRKQLNERNIAQVARAGQEFGIDERSAVVRDSVVLPSDELAKQTADIDRREAVAKILDNATQPDSLAYLALLRRLQFLLPAIVGAAALLFADDLGRLLFELMPGLQSVSGATGPTPLPVVVIRGGGIALVMLAVVTLFSSSIGLLQFRRYRQRLLELRVEEGAGAPELRRLQIEMDDALERLGPRRALRQLQDRKPPSTGGQGSSPPPAPPAQAASQAAAPPPPPSIHGISS